MAVTVERRVDQVCAAGGLADVAGHRQRLVQRGGERDVGVVAAGGEDDAGTGAVQGLGETRAQAGRRAGDDRDTAVEPVHGVRR